MYTRNLDQMTEVTVAKTYTHVVVAEGTNRTWPGVWMPERISFIVALAEMVKTNAIRAPLRPEAPQMRPLGVCKQTVPT